MVNNRFKDEGSHDELNSRKSARDRIDEQLEAAGWKEQSNNLLYLMTNSTGGSNARNTSKIGIEKA